jgi:hypothetical protein
MPKDIPHDLYKVYKNEFEGLGIFLGTGYIANQKRNYMSYAEAKKYAQSLKLNSGLDWLKHVRSKDFKMNIPIYPSIVYKKEFEGMNIFLGTGKIYHQNKVFTTYENAKKYAQSLNLKNRKEWFAHTKSKEFPSNIPRTAHRVYKKEFENYDIFLNTGLIATKNKLFVTYKEAKKYAQSLNLKSQREWRRHIKSKYFPNNIPKTPQVFYKNEFEGMDIFLKGIKSRNTSTFVTYMEARKYAKSLNIKTLKEWRLHTKSKDFPNNIPKAPTVVYKTECKGWPDFFGIERKTWKLKS